jgi:hypothetical protein
VHGVGVALAGAAVGRRERGQLEPRVIGQQADEPLPDRTRRAQDRDHPLLRDVCHLVKV